MGFLERIFGKQEQKEFSLNLTDIEKFLENETLAQKQVLSKNTAGKFAEIKYVLRNLEVLVKNLEKKEVSGQNQRLLGIARTSKQQAVRQLSSIVQRLQPPQSTDLKSVVSYSRESIALLERESRVFGKNVAYTSIYLKDEVKEIGAMVKELIDLLNSLKDEAMQYSALAASEKILESKNTAQKQKERTLATEKSIASAKSIIAVLEKERSTVRETIALLERSEVVSRLSLLETEKKSFLRKKQELAAETLNLFSSVDKPLKRLNSLIATGKFPVSGEQKEFFSLLVSEPLLALRRDPRGEKVKEALSELKKAMVEGTVQLKEKEKEKKLSALDQLIGVNFFESFFWKSNELDTAVYNIEKQLNSPELRKISSE